MLKKSILTFEPPRRLYCIKKVSWRRDYPQDPEEIKGRAIYDYGKSQTDYRKVFVWGNVELGALGVPFHYGRSSLRRTEHYIPTRLGFAEKFFVTTAACGYGYTLLATVDDKKATLYGTGLNSDNQIGYHYCRPGHSLGILMYPWRVLLPFVRPYCSKIKKVSAGRTHSAVLTNEGIFTLGNNAYGQCGVRIEGKVDYSKNRPAPHLKRIDEKKVIDVECGQDHTMVITKDGAVYSCGLGADGQTGLDHHNNVSKFTQVKGDILNENIVKLSSRSDFVLALNSEGKVFGWGNVEYGQMQFGDGVQQIFSPTHLKMLDPMGPIVDIAAGGTFCLALNKAGEVFVWGFGVLGVGPNEQNLHYPKQIPSTLFGQNVYQENNEVVKIKAGVMHCGAITRKGDLYMWGRNKKRCLGLLHEQDQHFPLKVGIGGIVGDAFLGLDHTVAICKPFI